MKRRAFLTGLIAAPLAAALPAEAPLTYKGIPLVMERGAGKTGTLMLRPYQRETVEMLHRGTITGRWSGSYPNFTDSPRGKSVRYVK